MVKKLLFTLLACPSYLLAMVEKPSIPKNRGCMNQVSVALGSFCEMAGRESICKYNKFNSEKLKVIREAEFNPTLIKGNVLLCGYISASSKQDLIVLARSLCLKKRGLYFLTGDNDVFAAALSSSVTNISITAIINGLKEKYGATNIISFADPEGYCFQGTLATTSTNLHNNLKTWIE